MDRFRLELSDGLRFLVRKIERANGCAKELLFVLQIDQRNAPSLRHMDEGFARGDFDFIAAGRALLADAAWGDKLRDGALDRIERYDPSQLEALD